MRRLINVLGIGKARLLEWLPVAPGVVLLVIALCLPAIDGGNEPMPGWIALLMSFYLLIMAIPAVVVIAWTLVSSVVGGELHAQQLAIGVVTLLSLLANPMLFVSCLTVVLGKSRVGAATGLVAVAGMMSAWWVIASDHGPFVNHEFGGMGRRPMSGYYVWCGAGVAVVAGACIQWVLLGRTVRQREGPQFVDGSET